MVPIFRLFLQHVRAARLSHSIALCKVAHRANSGTTNTGQKNLPDHCSQSTSWQCAACEVRQPRTCFARTRRSSVTAARAGNVLHNQSPGFCANGHRIWTLRSEILAEKPSLVDLRTIERPSAEDAQSLHIVTASSLIVSANVTGSLGTNSRSASVPIAADGAREKLTLCVAPHKMRTLHTASCLAVGKIANTG